jgi:hypothetical protein
VSRVESANQFSCLTSTKVQMVKKVMMMSVWWRQPAPARWPPACSSATKNLNLGTNISRIWRFCFPGTPARELLPTSVPGTTNFSTTYYIICKIVVLTTPVLQNDGRPTHDYKRPWVGCVCYLGNINRFDVATASYPAGVSVVCVCVHTYTPKPKRTEGLQLRVRHDVRVKCARVCVWTYNTK